MKIQRTIQLNELDFLKNIEFYGDANLDKWTIERIEELKELFSSVLYELYVLDKNISDRKEESAIDIRRALGKMRRELLLSLSLYENIAGFTIKDGEPFFYYACEKTGEEND